MQVRTELWQRPSETQVWRERLSFRVRIFDFRDWNAEQNARVKKKEPFIHSFIHSPFVEPIQYARN